MTEWSLATAKRALRDHGARRIFAKLLSPNDNSKNQVYLGGDFEVLQVLPSGEPTPSTTGSHGEPIFKSPLKLFWIDPEGRAFAAPNAQLILYPQYPEVRMSGFLRGAKWAPVEVLTVRDEGRVLLLGIGANEEILAIACAANTALAKQLHELQGVPAVSVLLDLGVPDGPSAEDSKSELLNRLCEISQKGWIDAWRLMPDGSRAPCNGTNCVGVTLESELGILANGRAEPDFLGWEVKSLTVAKLSDPRPAAVTLMTPEPTGGEYVTGGVENFIRKYGYPDKRGRKNRRNFGGVHRVGARHQSTQLLLEIDGYNVDSDTIVRADGTIALTARDGAVAASWDFPSLLKHWNHKHARAAYVPANARRAGGREYRYGGRVLLAEGTDFLRLLAGIASGIVYYDPGIKLEINNGVSSTKRRSQWRVAGKRLPELYSSSGWAAACQ